MPHSQPQRPFVPHRTPNRRQSPAAPAEFRISRPFVPGAERVAPELATSTSGHTTTEVAPEPRRLPGIEQFLALEPAPTRPASSLQSSFDDDFEEQDELPPVEHFLDPLPPVADFSPEDRSAFDDGRDGEAGYAVDSTARAETDSSGWVETDWQNYDWSAAAALGEAGASEASSAWATTDWDIGAPRSSAARPTAAQAIANALDQIAERIRAGELVVPSPGKMSDPASIAAAVAAMLGIRE